MLSVFAAVIIAGKMSGYPATILCMDFTPIRFLVLGLLILLPQTASAVDWHQYYQPLSDSVGYSDARVQVDLYTVEYVGADRDGITPKVATDFARLRACLLGLSLGYSSMKLYLEEESTRVRPVLRDGRTRHVTLHGIRISARYSSKKAAAMGEGYVDMKSMAKELRYAYDLDR